MRELNRLSAGWGFYDNALAETIHGLILSTHNRTEVISLVPSGTGESHGRHARLSNEPRLNGSNFSMDPGVQYKKAL